ncbi:hypothetical protein Dimus_008529 [Dionaea muscipula]
MPIVCFLANKRIAAPPCYSMWKMLKPKHDCRMMKTTMEEERGRGAKARTLLEKATNSTAPDADPFLLKAIKNQDGRPLVRIGTPNRRHPNGSHVASTLSA